MKPPYEITPEILHLLTELSRLLGQVEGLHLDKPSPQLRKRNAVKTIHGTLKIEGNTLNEEQITALLDGRPVIGPKKDILEVLNTVRAYEKLAEFNPYSLASLQKAHKVLMEGLMENPGRFRTRSAGIAHGDEITHIAPPAGRVPGLMKDLMLYMKNDPDPLLIKSCVFHYELEFIHPFADGNGRLGRLWQTRLLMEVNPVFKFLPLESIIAASQDAYYRALALSDKAGQSTPFITYQLAILKEALRELLKQPARRLTRDERLAYLRQSGLKSFTRKDYMQLFKNISPATASRDLQQAIREGWLKKTGDKNKTVYFLTSKNK